MALPWLCIDYHFQYIKLIVHKIYLSNGNLKSSVRSILAEKSSKISRNWCYGLNSLSHCIPIWTELISRKTHWIAGSVALTAHALRTNGYFSRMKYDTLNIQSTRIMLTEMALVSDCLRSARPSHLDITVIATLSACLASHSIHALIIKIARVESGVLQTGAVVIVLCYTYRFFIWN